MDTQKTINEIIALLDALWDAHPTQTQEQVDAKENLRQRIEALNDNKTSEDISLKGWIELGDIFLGEKREWLAKKAQLEKDLKEEKAAKEAKETELKQAKEAIGDKLTPELVEKLGKLNTEELKTLLETVKNNSEKKATLELSESERKELAKDLQPTNYWSIGACVLAGIACLIATGFGLFLRKEEKK